MRVLGFLTGVGLLAGLFLLADQMALFSGRGSLRQDNLKSNPAKTTQKLADTKNNIENIWVADITRQEGDEIRSDIAIDHPDLQVNSDTLSNRPPIELPKHLQPKTLVEAEPIRSTAELNTILEQTTQAKPESEVSLELETAAEFELEPDQSITESEPVVAVAPVLLTDTIQWHTFWGPFKTRNSAQGFTDYVAKRTDIEINIIERKPGQYMVAYPYRTESDREATALLIKERTALNISKN